MTARSIANRANAAHSTGPRTRRGKARASRNALRHGLAARGRADDGADAMRLAGLICDAGNSAGARSGPHHCRMLCVDRAGPRGRAPRHSSEWRSTSCPRSSATSAARCRAGGGRWARSRCAPRIQVVQLHEYNHEFCLAERTQCARPGRPRLPPQLPARDLRALHHRVELRPHDAGVDLVRAGEGRKAAVGAGDDVLAPDHLGVAAPAAARPVRDARPARSNA